MLGWLQGHLLKQMIMVHFDTNAIAYSVVMNVYQKMINTQIDGTVFVNA